MSEPNRNYHKKKFKKKPVAKKGKIPTPAEKLSSILPKLCEEIHFDDRVKEMSVLRLWEQLIPEPFKTHTKAKALQRLGGKMVLMVSVQNAAMASELSFNLETFKTLMNDFSGETGILIDDIRVRVGS